MNEIIKDLAKSVSDKNSGKEKALRLRKMFLDLLDEAVNDIEDEALRQGVFPEHLYPVVIEVLSSYLDEVIKPTFEQYKVQFNIKTEPQTNSTNSAETKVTNW